MVKRVFGSLVILCVLAVVGLSSVSATAAPRYRVQSLASRAKAIHTFKSRSARMAKSDRYLFKRTSSRLVSVVVKLDYDGVASYVGGVRGYAPTSPERTGKTLRRNSEAVTRYLRYVANREAAIVSAIRTRVPQARLLRSLRIAFGGVSLRLPAKDVKKLVGIKGVAAVMDNRLARPLTDASPQFIGADRAWRMLSGPTTGEGVKVAVLDTGFWPEHPSYTDPGIEHPGGKYACDYSDELGGDFECNDKLIGAQAFLDTYMAILGSLEGEFCNNETGECSARDADGHGTHTSTTAAGRQLEEAVVFGVDRGPISGIAPGAHVLGYRVCLFQGCFQDDSVAAVGQAILDEADVLNFSISGGEDPYSDPVELAFLDAYAAGIAVNASAGNAGPGPATANHAGAWVTTVGASTSDRHFLSDLTLTAGNGDTFEATGATITAGVENPTPVVLAEDVEGYKGTALCEVAFPDGSLDGKVVMCQRGVQARVFKGYNASVGGAEGMILYNPDILGVNTDNHWVPTIHLEGPEPGLDAVEFVDSHRSVVATWGPGEPREVQGDVMVAFSSRGPLGPWLKPDVTSVGIQVLAGNSPEPLGPPIGPEAGYGPPGQLFQAIAGTSMSSPHSAGSAALVEAAHLAWSPGQIKSALMTTSSQAVTKEGGEEEADPFDRGAGSVRPANALNPGLVFDESADDYFASAVDDPNLRIDLNLPSIYAPTMPGRISTVRTADNVSDGPLTYSVRTTAPENSSIAVEPESFTVEAGESVDLHITIQGGQLEDSLYFGEIRLNLETNTRGAAGLAQQLTLPVAFFKQSSAIPLTLECDPTTIGVDDRAECSATAENFGPEDANVDLEVRSNDPDTVDLRNNSAGDNTRRGFRVSSLLEGADPPTIDALAEGGAGFGYVSLGELGVDPIPGVGDETIINLDLSGLPPVVYGSEEYGEVGMVSNGYVVVGGGGADDVNFVPQDIPDESPPNNVLAPFWTDLDPSAGGNIYAALLTDDETGKSYVVLEWEEIPSWCCHDEPHTFQVWHELGNELNAFEYGPMSDGDDDVGVVVGAENRAGTSAVVLDGLPQEGDSLHVETSPPAPGGSLAVTFEALGVSPGEAVIRGYMRSDATPGTAVRGVVMTVEA